MNGVIYFIKFNGQLFSEHCLEEGKSVQVKLTPKDLPKELQDKLGGLR